MEIQPTTAFALQSCKPLDQMRKGKTDSYKSLPPNQTAWQDSMGANRKVFPLGLKRNFCAFQGEEGGPGDSSPGNSFTEALPSVTEGAPAGHPGGQDEWHQGKRIPPVRRRGLTRGGPVGGAWAGGGRGLGGRSASPSQSASSERSWQSASPSQRSRRSTHWPRAQGNWAAEHTGQPSSSLWSSHSGKPSQRQAPGMQSISPVAQANWSGEQVGGSGEDRKTVTRRPAQRRKNQRRASGAAPAPSALRVRPVCCPSPAGEEGRGINVC